MNPRLVALAVAFSLISAGTCGAAPGADDLRVSVDGAPVPLHSFLEGDFGLFEQRGPVDVEIRTPFNTRWVDVRPRSSGITATVGADHRTVRFHMPAVLPVTVEFNDDLTRVLHLFAYAPEKDPRKPGAPHVLYFGPGVHDAGLIVLGDGDTLYLAPGAWVRGYVRSVGARNISILGRGVLDGSGARRRPPAAPVPASLSPAAARSAGYRSGNMIYLQGTTGARIEGITIFNSPGWTIYLKKADGTRIQGVRILNPRMAYGDDGIDISSSSDVRVEDAFIRTNDDCIAVKNLEDVATRDIGVRHCVLWNMPTGGNGLEIGFEMGHTTVSDIRFGDIDLIHVQRGSAISIHQGDSGTIEDVSYSDIRVEDVRRKLVDFTVLYAKYGLDRPATEEERERRTDDGGVWDGEQRFSPEERPAVARGRGRVRDVTVTNLSVVDGALPYSIVAGFDADHPVENVSIRGLSYLGRQITSAKEGKFVVENAPGFSLR